MSTTNKWVANVRGKMFFKMDLYDQWILQDTVLENEQNLSLTTLSTTTEFSTFSEESKKNIQK